MSRPSSCYFIGEIYTLETPIISETKIADQCFYSAVFKSRSAW